MIFSRYALGIKSKWAIPSDFPDLLLPKAQAAAAGRTLSIPGGELPLGGTRIAWWKVGLAAAGVFGLTWLVFKLRRRGGPVAGLGHRFAPSCENVAVDVWAERDRLHIHAYNRKTEKTVAEWWDEDAYSMIEDGFLQTGGMADRDHRVLKRSVLSYLADNGLCK